MDRAQAGHGAMGDMGVHLIDLVRWNFGEFERVTAQAGVAYPARTVPGAASPPTPRTSARDWASSSRARR